MMAVLAGRSSYVSSGWIVAQRAGILRTEMTRTVCVRYHATVTFSMTTVEAKVRAVCLAAGEDAWQGS